MMKFNFMVKKLDDPVWLAAIGDFSFLYAFPSAACRLQSVSPLCHWIAFTPAQNEDTPKKPTGGLSDRVEIKATVEKGRHQILL